MKLKFKKTILLSLLSLGSLTVVPACATSCNNPTKPSNIKLADGFEMPDFDFVKGIPVHYSCVLGNHITYLDGSNIVDKDNIKITISNLPKGLKGSYDKKLKIVSIIGTPEETGLSTINFSISYDNEAPLKVSLPSEIEQEKDFPVDWLDLGTTGSGSSAQTNNLLKISGEPTVSEVRNQFLNCNTLRIPRTAAWTDGNFYPVTGLSANCFYKADTGSKTSIAYIPDEAHICVVFDDDAEDPCNVTTINNYAFTYCVGIKSIALPSSLITLGTNVFYGCSGLTNIDIPEKVTKIDTNDFAECANITSFDVPDNVTQWGDTVLYDCSSLVSLHIGKGLNSSGQRILRESPLEDITVDPENTTVGLAWNLGSKAKVVLNKSGTLNPEGLDTGLEFKNTSKAYASMACGEIEIPDTVTALAADAFVGCAGITSVRFPSEIDNVTPRITSIGNTCFWTDINLTSIYYPGIKDSFQKISLSNSVFGSPLPKNGTLYAISTQQAKDIQALLISKFPYCGIATWKVANILE